MTEQVESILDYLSRVRRNDREKHGPEASGWRSTREVADFYSISLAVARRRLNALYDRDAIKSADEGATHVWRAK